MCQFFSGVITYKNRDVLYDLDNDHHGDLLEKAGLKDNSTQPNFVRVELLPIDNDKFNHDLKNWKLQVDQDYKPDWFDEALAESLMKKELKEVFKQRFIINNKSGQVRKGQRLFVKNSSVVARENSSVVARGNSSVEARENSSVEARENSSVEARENSSVVARGNSQILIPNYSWSSRTGEIKGVYGNASVKDLTKNRIIIANPDMKLVRFKAKK